MPMAVEVLPKDEQNARLVDNVHPPDWVNPEPAPRYNIVVIGAGTAGLVTAAGAAGLGAKVALIERDLLGGDCLNVGCVPSKALIRSARAAAEVRDADRFGVRVPPGVRVDFPAVMERMRRLRASISPHDSAARFRGLGVDVFLGQAAFSGPDTIDAGGKILRFRRAVIATGARATTRPFRDWRTPVSSPTRPSSRSPNCRSGWPSSAPAQSVANWLSLSPVSAQRSICWPIILRSCPGRIVMPPNGSRRPCGGTAWN